VSALVISYHDGLVHLHSGVPSLARGSLTQFLLVEDYAQLCQALEDKPLTPVFVDVTIATDPLLSPKNNLGVKHLMDMIQTKYRVVTRSGRGCIYMRADQ
jgi:hypothetical protein